MNRNPTKISRITIAITVIIVGVIVLAIILLNGSGRPTSQQPEVFEKGLGEDQGPAKTLGQ